MPPNRKTNIYLQSIYCSEKRTPVLDGTVAEVLYDGVVEVGGHDVVVPTLFVFVLKAWDFKLSTHFKRHIHNPP